MTIIRTKRRTGDQCPTVSFRIETSKYEIFANMAEEENVSLSYVLARALDYYVDNAVKKGARNARVKNS